MTFDLAGLQVLDAVGGLGGDVVHLDAQILGQAVGKVDVIALILAVFIDVAERVLVRENADVDRAVRLDFVQRAVNTVADAEVEAVPVEALLPQAAETGSGLQPGPRRSIWLLFSW